MSTKTPIPPTTTTPSAYISHEMLACLKRYWGYTQFRPCQAETIKEVYMDRAVKIVSISIIFVSSLLFKLTLSCATPVEASQMKQADWLKDHYASQYIYIILDKDTVIFVEDGPINVSGSMGKYKRTLRLNDSYTVPDRHASATYTISAISPDAVQISYISSFDHNSFGKDLITTDKGTISVFYSQPWVPAVYEGDREKVKELLAKGWDVNSRDAFGRTPLMIAAYRGYEDMVKMFLEKGADINAKQKEGVFALILVHNNINMLKLLVTAGADINEQDKNGITVLMRLVGDRQIPFSRETYDFLISKGANPDLKNKFGSSAKDWLKKRLEEEKQP